MITVAALMLAACGGGDDAAPSTTRLPVGPDTTDEPVVTTAAPTTAAPTTTATPTTAPATSSSTSTTTTLPPIPRQPLVGIPLADGEEPIARPALAVKIDNASSARRNHSGLAVADIVFEEIVEGSITRFAAVFHSSGSDVVGPIRSGRSQDVDMLTSLRRPLFAWSGGNPGVEALIAGSTLVDLNWQAGGQGYYRGSGSIPHNLYNSTERLWSQTPADHPGAPPEQFPYLRPGKEFAGTAVNGFELAMRGIDVDWTWDAESGRFLRSQQGAAHMDVQHGRIGAHNVVVMGVQYKPSTIDARSPEAQTIGFGPLWVFSDGEVIHGKWIRESADQPWQLYDEADNPIGLRPGNTWVELAERFPTSDETNPGIELEIAFA
ncbi:MAG: hypothetical protein CL424_07700 [Acidimicrobiaceae bacterium]|nr:hypothetical protein [Acidimicrobiaceae bacterium]